MAKNNVRSIRFTDEVADLIDQQIGNNFTEKFENLIRKCAWEVPSKEAEARRLDELIGQKREYVKKLISRTDKLHYAMADMERRTKLLQETLEYMLAEMVNECGKSL